MAGTAITEYTGGPRWRKALRAGIPVAIPTAGRRIFTGEITIWRDAGILNRSGMNAPRLIHRMPLRA